MSDQIRKRLFTNTAAALIEFDAGAAARDKAWRTAETAADIDAAEQADHDATRKVQEAFHQDTADINCMANCLGTDIAFMRRMAADTPKPEADPEQAPPTKLTGYERKCFND